MLQNIHELQYACEIILKQFQESFHALQKNLFQTDVEEG